MKQRHSFAWMDLLWVLFLVGLAALPQSEQVPEPEPAFHKYLILIAIGLLQIFEHRFLDLLPRRGRVYIVLLKICLGSLLVDHTGGISSSYYLIYFVPV